MKREQIEQLKSYFSNQPVELVYLFGSKAKGNEKPYSDTDFAILFKEELSDQERFKIKLKIIGDLSVILKMNNLDIVDLKDASPFLKFEAIKQRFEIYIKDEILRVAFERKVLSEYFDMQYYLRRHIDKGLQDLKQEYGIKTR